MERFVSVRMTASAFVNWEEVFSTNPRGRREVRYYLKRRDGTSDLAVVGKEKKLGHHTKTTTSSSSRRYRYSIRDKSLFSLSNSAFGISSKLRSRREVIDWLSSLVTDVSSTCSTQPVTGDTFRSNIKKFEDVHLNKLSRHTTEFLWVGPSWTCRKNRRHYEAYSRGGVKISVHDFVYVLAEEGKRLVAYVDDLYEDSKGNKMSVVRWFHKVDEVGLDLPHKYNNDKEIFFSLSLQDLSIECIDGLATVLSPQHYDNFLKLDAHNTMVDPFVCRNLFDNQVVKPFDITQVKSYWNQNIHRFMSTDALGIRPMKRLRRNLSENNVMQKHEYSIGSEIEVLSQDSGIRGMWFKAVVIKKHKDKLKVRYQDIKDAADEFINLEEWILSSRVAAPDQLGIRCSGRMMIRPSRLSNNNSDVCLVDVGCVVDAWLHDGWWEGIVVHKECDDRIHVYFPGEKERSIMGCKDLRYSEEWLGDGWKQLKNRPDVVASITETNSQTTKSTHDDTSNLSGTIHDKELSLGHKDNSCVVCRDVQVFDFDHPSKKDLLSRLNWNWSTKKRHGKKNLIALETRKCDGFLMPPSVKVDHESCKFICAPVASPLTSLVMSR